MICVEMEMADLCILNDENCVVVANQLHRITLSLSAVGTRKRKECCVACDVNCFVECWILSSTLQAKCFFLVSCEFEDQCVELKRSSPETVASHDIRHTSLVSLASTRCCFTTGSHRIQLYMWWTVSRRGMI